MICESTPNKPSAGKSVRKNAPSYRPLIHTLEVEMDTSKETLSITIDDLSFLLQAAYEDSDDDGTDEKFLYLAMRTYMDGDINKNLNSKG
jgi:hypothetical protein